MHWQLPRLRFRRKKEGLQRIRLIGAFIGVIFIWYGVWELLYSIPFLNHPVTALVLGLTILVTSGFFYDKMS